MAYKSNIQIEERIYENIIFRIQKISTANSEYEYFENVNDPKNPDIAQKLSWTNRFENTAVIYCWVDGIARNNRAHPFHWFNLDFEWNPYEKTSENIYNYAYNALKVKYPGGTDI